MAQISLLGSIGLPGSSAILGSASISITNADHTLSASEFSNQFLLITSSVSLTTTRNIIAPLNEGQAFIVENATTGGHSLVLIGSTGAGATIPNDGYYYHVACDGTNYQVVGAPMSGSVSGPNSFPIVFQPGGTASVSNFITEATLNAALAASNGPQTVYVDFTQLTGSPGGRTYTLAAPIDFAGSSAYQIFGRAAQYNATPIMNLEYQLVIDGYYSIEFRDINFIMTGAANPAISSQLTYCIFSGNSSVNDGGTGTSFFSTTDISFLELRNQASLTSTNFSPLSNFNVTMRDQTALSGTVSFPAIFVASGKNIQIDMYDAAFLNANAIEVQSGGFVSIVIHSPDVFIDASYFSISGVTIIYGPQASLIGYAPAITGNWSPTPTLTSTALDQLAARTHTASGDLSGTYPSPIVAKLQGNPVQSGTLGSGQNGYALVWNNGATQWQATSLSGLTPGGSAGGDLSGSYPNPTVTHIRGVQVASFSPTGGQFFVYTGSQWEPASISGDVGNSIVTPGDLVVFGLLGQPIQASPVATAGQYLIENSGGTGSTWTTLSGDVTSATSTPGKITVTALQGNAVLSGTLGATQDGYALIWVNSASKWEAQPVPGSGTFVPTGTGIPHIVSGVQNAAASLIVNADVDPAAAIAYSKLNLTGDIVNTDISSSAAIAYSKLALTNSIVNNDVSTSAAIAYSKLNLVGDIVNNDISPTAGITYTKLNLTNAIVNNDIFATAAIAGTKISPAFGSQNVSTTGTLSAGATTITSIQDTGLSTGIVHSDSSGNFTSSPVNLASADVTGILATSHQANQSMGGDVSGTTNAVTVIAIQNNDIKPGILGFGQDGYVLTWSFTDGYWEAKVSGGGPPTGPASGDLGADYPNPTVIAIQNNPIESGILGIAQDGYVLAWNNTAVQWQAQPITAGSITLGGDVSGPATSNTVNNIHGSSVPAGGSLVTGNVLQVNGSSSLTYAPINLAGGSNYVINLLPNTNQADQVVAGDVTGTTGSNTLHNIQGNPIYLGGILGPAQDGYVVAWNNSDGYLTMEPAASGSFVAGGDLSGTSTSQTVVEIQGNQIDLGGLLGAMQDGYVLTWDNSLNKLVMEQAATGTALSGDVTGPIADNTVGQRKTFLFMGC